uniref:Uncharacterized protein n=1 Tax=Avena sativa TaxID=4498 RepID=A0ACD5Y463_AVESA
MATEVITSGLAGMNIFGNHAGLSGVGEKAKVEIVPWAPRYDEDDDDGDNDEFEDPDEEAFAAHRRSWERRFSRRFGSFEDETTLGPMRHTQGPIPSNALPDGSLQFFGISVTDLKPGLKWPLQVYGFVATRDSADHNRNFLFRCTRNNSQTLTRKDPYLLLTGPSRTVVLIDPVVFEFELKLKGKTESEDEVLAFKTFSFDERFNVEGGIRACSLHKRCNLDFMFALLEESVEATVTAQVVEGSWLDDYGLKVICHTESMKEHEMVLLDSRGGKMPINSDGMIELSRRVIGVDYPSGKLVVWLVASCSNSFVPSTVAFSLKESGKSERDCDVWFCKVRVTVAWSLLSGPGYD